MILNQKKGEGPKAINNLATRFLRARKRSRGATSQSSKEAEPNASVLQPRGGKTGAPHNPRRRPQTCSISRSATLGQVSASELLGERTPFYQVPTYIIKLDLPVQKVRREPLKSVSQ